MSYYVASRHTAPPDLTEPNLRGPLRALLLDAGKADGVGKARLQTPDGNPPPYGIPEFAASS